MEYSDGYSFRFAAPLLTWVIFHASVKLIFVAVRNGFAMITEHDARNVNVSEPQHSNQDADTDHAESFFHGYSAPLFRAFCSRLKRMYSAISSASSSVILSS